MEDFLGCLRSGSSGGLVGSEAGIKMGGHSDPRRCAICSVKSILMRPVVYSACQQSFLHDG